MERQVVQSSQIHSIGFNPETKTMQVEFRSRKPKEPNSVYEYQNVDPKDHNALMAAESHGSFWIRNLKTKYKGKKL